MIPCPSCGLRINRDVEVCPHCLGDLRAAMAAEAKKAGGGGGRKKLLTILAVLGGGFLLCCGGFIILQPMVTTPRDSARRSESRNNLKQIGLALHNYHDSEGVLPPGSVTDDTGRRHHSWQALLLPYLDSISVAKQIDFNKPWDDPANATAFKTTIRDFINLNVEQQTLPSGYGISHYAGNSRVLYDNSSTRFADITDGTSNTIFAGEVAENLKAWGDPTNIRDPALGINSHPDSFGSNFRGSKSAQLLMMDGSVRNIMNDIDPALLKALATPAGGEVIDEDALK